MRLGLTTLSCVLVASIAAAQAHPRLFTSALQTRVQDKNTADTSDWLAILGAAGTQGSSCERITQTTAGTPDSLPPVYEPGYGQVGRPAVPSTPPGYVYSEYQGFGYYYPAVNLIVCHMGTGTAKYKTQALKILRAATAPFATVTPASPPAIWSPFTSRPAYYVSNDGPAGQVRVHQTLNRLSNGATVTLSGVLGCTTANTTGKVANATTNTFDLVGVDGVTPVICNAVGTNYNHDFASDGGYSYRNYATFLPMLYDWFYADLTADDKTAVYNMVNAFYDEFKYVSTAAPTTYVEMTLSNYHAAFFAGTGLTGILTRGAGENPRGSEIYTYWRDTLYELQDQPYYQRWLDNNGGSPEAIRYQPLSASNIALTLMAQKNANAEDLFADFDWIQGLMRYWIHNTMPPRNYMSYRGYIPSPNDTTGTNPNPWKDLRQGMSIVHAIAVDQSDAFAPKFKQWVEDLVTQNGQTYVWLDVLFWDSAAASSAWSTTEPLSLPQLSNPAGGYGRVTMRSDWTTGAVLGDIWSTAHISHMGNGKERRDKGSIYVQRGDTHLLISATAEATRSNSITAWNYMANLPADRNEGFGVFAVKRDNFYVTQAMAANSGTTLGNDIYAQPGYRSIYPSVITSHPTRIDRYEDATSYVYSRSVELDEPFADWHFTTYYPVFGWTREILYLRPKVFVVYDRTRKVDRVSPAWAFTQEMEWVVGKTPVTAVYGTGMYRTEVSDGGTYKGALTYVLPASMPEPAANNYGGFSIAYQMQVSPPAETEYVNWLTVVDAADAQANLEEVAKLATSSNVDVIRLGTDTLVGFANYQDGASLSLPLTYTMAGVSDTITHRIAGLAASTTYNVTVSGNDVTINLTGGGSNIASTAAGVLEFESGAGGAIAVVVTTSSPMPSGTVGTAYNQCLAASGGDGGPYTYALDSGTLPAGTSLTAGCITGTPTTANTYNFAVTANDGTDTSAAKSLSIVIAANPVSITTTALPNGIDGQVYSAQICAEGGTEPYVWDTTPDTGTLPTGLTITNGSPCATLSGTPSVVGLFSFTVDLADDDAQTDDQALTVQVSPSLSTTFGLHVLAGSNSALVVFGGAGLQAGTTCTVQIRDGEVVVAENEETIRFARQRSAFTGLAPETIYGAIATCPNATGPGVVSFTTKAIEASSAVTVPLKLKPSSILASATQVTVDYGVSSTSENTQTVACTSGCTVNLSLSAGIYIYRWIWKNAGGTALATSNTRELIVP